MVKNLQKQLSIACPADVNPPPFLLAQNLDVVIAAETGSGKTYAYAISIVSDVLKGKKSNGEKKCLADYVRAHLCDQ